MSGPFDRLDDLRSLVLAVDTGSLTGAARALQLTPHAVSRRIMRLEALSGARLLHRTTRRLAPTSEGLILYTHAVRALAALDEAHAELDTGQRALTGTVRIAIPPALATQALLARFGTLIREHEHLQLQLVVTNTAVDLTAGAFDAAVRVGALADSSLVLYGLGEAAWPLCASPAYVAAHGMPMTPDALAAHRCLRLLGDRPQLEWSLHGPDGQFVSAPVGGTFECDDSRVLGDAVYAGLGIGPRPAREVDRAVEAGTLTRVLPGWRFAAGPVSVVMPAGRAKVPRLAALLEVLREVVQEVL